MSAMESGGKFNSLQLVVTREFTVNATIGIPEWWPSGHRAAVILAHDASSNLDHPLLVALQESLVRTGFLTIRFNFPFAQDKRKRPDSPALLDRTYKTAIAALCRDAEEAPAQLVLCGFGLGARVASEVIASGLKADGLVCVSFPLHAAGKPSKQNADALYRIICPILFVQGSRDTRCRSDRLELLRRGIGAPTSVALVEDADHQLELIKRSVRDPDDVRAEVLSSIASFLGRTTGTTI
jgi:predicted alpha/beta-hydrolase family hydrolase